MGHFTPERAWIIAEAGVNHDGSLERALALVDAAARCGADAVKFQTFKAASLVAMHAPRAPYQGPGDQLSLLRALELGPDAFRALRDRAQQRGIEFLSTPFDEESADLLESLGVLRFKVSSGDITDHGLLRRIAQFKKPVILSTGMARNEEIADALETLDSCGAPEVTLLHCISSYPACPEELQLCSIERLRCRFRRRVGFSDHSIGIEACLVARALGASVLEKHITLDRRAPGPDHAASTEPEEFTRLVQTVRLVETMLGGAERTFSATELANRSAAHKSVVAARRILAGEVLSPTVLAVRRPGTGIAPRDLPRVVGRAAARDIPAGEPIRWEMVR